MARGGPQPAAAAAEPEPEPGAGPLAAEGPAAAEDAPYEFGGKPGVPPARRVRELHALQARLEARLAALRGRVEARERAGGGPGGRAGPAPPAPSPLGAAQKRDVERLFALKDSLASREVQALAKHLGCPEAQARDYFGLMRRQQALIENNTRKRANVFVEEEQRGYLDTWALIEKERRKLATFLDDDRKVDQGKRSDFAKFVQKLQTIVVYEEAVRALTVSDPMAQLQFICPGSEGGAGTQGMSVLTSWMHEAFLDRQTQFLVAALEFLEKLPEQIADWLKLENDRGLVATVDMITGFHREQVTLAAQRLMRRWTMRAAANTAEEERQDFFGDKPHEDSPAASPAASPEASPEPEPEPPGSPRREARETVKAGPASVSGASPAGSVGGTPKKNKRRRNTPWTPEEAEALVDGVTKCGTGRWADIKKLHGEALTRRSEVDLKDKWRHLKDAAVRPAGASPARRRSELPADLLQRVRRHEQLGEPAATPTKQAASTPSVAPDWDDDDDSDEAPAAAKAPAPPPAKAELKLDLPFHEYLNDPMHVGTAFQNEVGANLGAAPDRILIHTVKKAEGSNATVFVFKVADDPASDATGKAVLRLLECKLLVDNFKLALAQVLEMEAEGSNRGRIRTPAGDRAVERLAARAQALPPHLQSEPLKRKAQQKAQLAGGGPGAGKRAKAGPAGAFDHLQSRRWVPPPFVELPAGFRDDTRPHGPDFRDLETGAWKQVVTEQYRFLAAEGVPPVPKPQPQPQRHESPASPRTKDAKRASFNMLLGLPIKQIPLEDQPFFGNSQDP